MIPVHVRCNNVIDLVRLHAERLQTFADRMNDFARAFLRRGFIKAGLAHDNRMRARDDPDVVGDRCPLIMRIAEDVVLRSLARMRRVTDGVNLVDIIAHDFLPMVTPARFSIILTMAVKSLSPPNSVLVVSHWPRTALMTEF